MTREYQEIHRDNRAPDIRVEGTEAAPSAASEAEAALEEGDTPFYAGSEFFQLCVDPAASDHRAYCQPALFSEAHICDPLLLYSSEVEFGAEPPIKGGLSRNLAIEFFLPVNHL